MKKIVTALLVVSVLAGAFFLIRQPRAVDRPVSAPPPRTPTPSSGADPAAQANSTPSSATPLEKSTVAERMRVADSLRSETLPNLLAEWLQLIRSESDHLRATIVGEAVVNALQRSTYGKTPPLDLGAWTETNFLSNAELARLTPLLGRASTKDSLTFLLRLAASAPEVSLRDAAIAQVAKIGTNRWDSRFHEELSPMLEEIWRNESADSGLRRAAGVALTKVGAPSGVALLLSSAVAGPSDSALSRTAADSLLQVRNPAAVPILEAALAANPAQSKTAAIAGETLAAMGDPAATQALLRWAQKTGDEAAPQVKRWFLLVRDTESLRLLERAAANAGSFQSAQNAEAVRAALANWHAAQTRN